MSLHRRLLLLTVTMALLIGAGVMVVMVLAAERDREAARAVDLRTATVTVSKYDNAVLDQETGQRGFLLTGMDSFLEPFERGKGLMATLGEQLEEMLAGTAFADDVAEMRVAAETWQTGAAIPEIELRRTSGVQASAQAVAGGAGRELFDEYRARISGLETLVADAAADSRQRVSDLSDRISQMLTALLIGVTVVLLAGAATVRRWVLRPVGQVAAGARRVREGELDFPISADGPPEISRLAQDIDGMRRTLVRYLDDSERSRRALEQNAALVLAMRSDASARLDDLPGRWTANGEVRSAEGLIAGDSFDLVQLSDDEVGVIVVDIAGHGAVEGLLALRCREQLRAALAAGAAPGEALKIVADQFDQLATDMFLTAFTARIDLRDGSCRYANAGHPPPLVTTPAGGIWLDPTGPLIGPVAGNWRTATTEIPAGGHLLAYTDGITESRRADGEFYGEDRLRAVAESGPVEAADVLVDRYLRALADFDPAGQRDDVTLLVVARAMPTG